MYLIKAKAKKTQISLARYGHKVFRKGGTYTVRRKLTPYQRTHIKSLAKGFRILSVKKI